MRVPIYLSNSVYIVCGTRSEIGSIKVSGSSSSHWVHENTLPGTSRRVLYANKSSYSLYFLPLYPQTAARFRLAMEISFSDHHRTMTQAITNGSKRCAIV